MCRHNLQTRPIYLMHFLILMDNFLLIKLLLDNLPIILHKLYGCANTEYLCLCKPYEISVKHWQCMSCDLNSTVNWLNWRESRSLFLSSIVLVGDRLDNVFMMDPEVSLIHASAGELYNITPMYCLYCALHARI